jgi:hypothetical protein
VRPLAVVGRDDADRGLQRRRELPELDLAWRGPGFRINTVILTRHCPQIDVRQRAKALAQQVN